MSAILSTRITETREILTSAVSRLGELIPTVESIERREIAVAEREVLVAAREKTALDAELALNIREGDVAKREKNTAQVREDLSKARVARDAAIEDARLIDLKYQDVKKELGNTKARVALFEKAVAAVAMPAKS